MSRGIRIPYDWTDLLFRLFFSLVFLGLGGEHLFADELIRSMMPAWLPAHRLVSVLCGVVLLAGGLSVLLGYRLRAGAAMLAVFLVLVTVSIHGPALWRGAPAGVAGSQWLWDLYQRSNFVKNMCLLGCCLHLLNHRPGRFSLDHRRGRQVPMPD